MIQKLALLFLCTTFIFLQSASGQDQSESDSSFYDTMEDTLGFLSYIMINDSLADQRFLACNKFIPTLVQTLKRSESFDYPFDRLSHISIQYPADSSFRIFSWQLYVDENNYRYYGAIQVNSEELQLFPLIDRSWEITDVEKAVLTPENWYGVVYYNIMSFQDEKKQTKYLLFGYDGNTFFQKRKIVDVLHFIDGKPYFGSPVFHRELEGYPPASLNRLLVEYSAEATVRLNYDPIQERITFDNLIPLGGRLPSGDPVLVPDGSYCGYELKKGRWNYVDKLFFQTQDEPPRPMPILEDKSKIDLFGKEKKEE